MLSYMKRTVRVDLLNAAIKKIGTAADFSKVANVCPRLISSARNFQPPAKEITRKLLAEAVGVGPDELFPPVRVSRKTSAGGNVAS